MCNEINVYCDESRHIQNDGSSFMVIGGVWISKNEIKHIVSDIRDIKQKYGLPRDYEIKWNKFLSDKLDFYKELIQYFFNSKMQFRAVVANKTVVSDDTYNEWYYRMYYLMLIHKLNKEFTYNIYIDIKGRRSGGIKIANMKKCLSRKLYDFDYKTIQKVQIIDSKESEIMQLADFLSGAIGYENNLKIQSSNRKKIINLIKDKSGFSLSKGTIYTESKFNLFFWMTGNVE